MNISKLDSAVKAVCPIHGVSVGDAADKATWRIDHKDEATAQQKVAAQSVVDAFDPAEPDTPVDQSDLDQLQKQMKALALVMRSYCNALKAGTYTNKSVADLKADFKQAFDSLP